MGIHANPANFVFVWVPVTRDKVVKVQEPLPNSYSWEQKHYIYNVIVTPCSVPLAIRQSPCKKGFLTQHRKPPRFNTCPIHVTGFTYEHYYFTGPQFVNIFRLRLVDHVMVSFWRYLSFLSQTYTSPQKFFKVLGESHYMI